MSNTNTITFIGYNIRTRDYKLFRCLASEFKMWIQSIFRDTHYNICIVKTADGMVICQKIEDHKKDPIADFKYTRTKVTHHPLADVFKREPDVNLQRNVRLQKENKPEAYMMHRI
jgi:hypothetical protein